MKKYILSSGFGTFSSVNIRDLETVYLRLKRRANLIILFQAPSLLFISAIASSPWCSMVWGTVCSTGRSRGSTTTRCPGPWTTSSPRASSETGLSSTSSLRTATHISSVSSSRSSPEISGQNPRSLGARRPQVRSSLTLYKVWLILKDFFRPGDVNQKFQRNSEVFFLRNLFYVMLIIRYKTYYLDGSVKKLKMNDIPDVEM